MVYSDVQSNPKQRTDTYAVLLQLVWWAPWHLS